MINLSMIPLKWNKEFNILTVVWEWYCLEEQSGNLRGKKHLENNLQPFPETLSWGFFLISSEETLLAGNN